LNNIYITQGTSNIVLGEINASGPEHLEDSEDYNVLQRQGHQLQGDETNMYSVNKNDVNDYGYDVSAHAPVHDKNENYSSTVGIETYDHLRRDNANRNTGRAHEDTYSHAQQSTFGEDEYNVLHGGGIPLESDYDQTHHSEDDQMYSNTNGLVVQETEANDMYS
jgi:hypothetical protein